MTDRISQTRRWSLTAATYTQKAVAHIKWLGDHRNADVRAVGVWEASELLRKTLSEAQTLAPYLGSGYEAEEAEQAAKDLVTRIRAHRLAGKLEQTTGRTPEETAAFLQRAADLRGGN